MRRRRGSQKTLSEIVAKVYPGRDPDELETIRAFHCWEETVPARVAVNARPVRLQRGLLTVHVTTSSWAQELQFLKADLLRSLQEKQKNKKVRDIRFLVGPLPETRLPQKPTREHSIPLRADELPEEVARALVQVKNQGLRETLMAAASTTLGPKVKR